MGKNNQNARITWVIASISSNQNRGSFNSKECIILPSKWYRRRRQNSVLCRKPSFCGRRVWKQIPMTKANFSEYLKQFLELWNALKPFRMDMWKHYGNTLKMVLILFENPLWNAGEIYSPILPSLSTWWWMRGSTICYNFFFFSQKCYFTTWLGTDLFIVVERSKDIMHVKLLPSLMAKIRCKRQ